MLVAEWDDMRWALHKPYYFYVGSSLTPVSTSAENKMLASNYTAVQISTITASESATSLRNRHILKAKKIGNGN